MAKTVTVPAAVAPGQYHVLACVDIPHVIFEHNEVDNCSASVGKVKVKAATPDRNITVWRPSSGEWFTLDRQTGTSSVAQWGAAGDVPVAADYDGDGKNDHAVWRPSQGNWWIIASSTGAQSMHWWGLSGDVPVPADYDGDGRADLAVWRPSDDSWYVISSRTGAASVRQWGDRG